MRRLPMAVAAALFAAFLCACGGGGHGSPPPLVADILSRQSLDGDITLDNGVLQPPVPATAFGNVQAGFDPGTLAIPPAETRGFLVFDLAPIPSTASIAFASVTLFVSQVNNLGLGATSFPFFLDLLDTRPGGTPPPLVSSDYSAPFLLDAPFAFLPIDVSNFVEIEVTSLMREAQTTSQPFFEIRLTPTLAETGFVTIDDGAPARAPLLHVEYF